MALQPYQRNSALSPSLGKLADISHELRTPIAAIRLYAETMLMKRDQRPEQAHSYLETILSESQRLSRAIDAIIEHLRMAGGKDINASVGTQTPDPVQEALILGNARIAIRDFQVRMNGKLVDLPSKAVGILKLLCENPNRAFTREEIIEKVWGGNSSPAVRTVDNHIVKLRAVFEPDTSHPKHIRTIWGVGYCFVPDEADSDVTDLVVLGRKSTYRR